MCELSYDVHLNIVYRWNLRMIVLSGGNEKSNEAKLGMGVDKESLLELLLFLIFISIISYILLMIES